MEEQGRPHRRGLSLGARLILGFGALFLLLVGLSGFVIYQLQRITAANEALALEAERAWAAEALSRTRMDLILTIDEGILQRDRETFRSLVGANLAAMNARYAELERLYEEVDPALDAAVYNLQNITEHLVASSAEEDWEAIRRTRVFALGGEINRISRALDDMVADVNAAQAEALMQAELAQRAVFRSVLLGSGVIGLLAFGVAFSTIRLFNRVIGELVTGAEELAAGNLNRRVAVWVRGGMGRLADAFNQMAARLQDLYGTLEDRIAARTAELEELAEQMRVSAEVGRMATTVLDPEELQRYIVRLISERFGFYHAGLFLVDEEKRWAVLRAASSEGGARMLERGHRLQAGTGVVGRVVETGEPYLALDTGEDAVYFDNPDLPETHSEVALPLRARGRIIGVLDVQSRDPEAFTPENVTVFQGLADQLALALSNARLYREAQDRLDAMQQIYGEFSRRSWQRLLRTQRGGYRYSSQEGLSRETEWSEAMRSAARNGELAFDVSGDDGEGAELAVPVSVRGRTIGVLDLRKPADAGAWTPAELEVVQALVEQMGPTLESTRLFSETQQRAAQERLTAEVTARLWETLDVDTVMRTALREIGEALEIGEIKLRLRDAEDLASGNGD
ncbi:MAG: GAF domain-containing protein [Anaerolineae bacterium]